MADRFPIIIESTEQQIQELSAGDGLDLTRSGVVNANYVHSAGVNVGVVTATSFIGDGSQITNIPAGGGSLEATASGTLADGDTTIVNADGTVSAVVQTGSGWITTLGDSGTDDAQGIAIDSSGNIIVIGYAVSSGQADIVIAKYNSSGTNIWIKYIGGVGYEEGNGVVTDSSDNIYITGYNPTNSRDILIAKFDSSGNLQWQKILGGSARDLGRGIAIDSSSNVYVCGETQSVGQGGKEMVISKYNSSGTFQWQRNLGGSGVDIAYGIAVDSSNNVYFTGLTSSGGSGNEELVVAKYNSSGTYQWQKFLGGTSLDEGHGISIDSSDNVYITGLTNSTGSGSYDILIAKYNSSGAVQWQRTLSGSGTDQGTDVTTDSSDNVYVGGYINTGSGYQTAIIAKYNSSGTIQWQRTLGSSSANDRVNAIVHDGSDNVYIAGYTRTAGAGNNDFLIARLPADGSETGTYGNFTYAASSLTDASSSLTSQNGSLTNSTANMTDSTSSFTSGSFSMTSSTTSMQSTNLTSENFIGISDGAYTNGQTATIQIAGSVDDAQSSLTPGQQYYVQTDGTLSETADSPSVLAGTAIAATKLAIG